MYEKYLSEPIPPRRRCRHHAVMLSVVIAYAALRSLAMHLKPTWLMDVSTGCAWRAAGR
jgi:hypothetical protein